MTVARFDEPESAVGLGVWAAEMRAAAEIAQGIAPTPFVPSALRDVATLTATLLAGREIGLSPMASMRSIDVISGTPALRAITARALVLARGHDLWVVESTSTRCIMRGQRRGSSHIQESTWTVDRARALGIAGRDAWRRQPTAMLVARATAEIARLVAPEALLGLPYVVEELGDDEVGSTVEVVDSPETEPAPKKRTARRKVRPVVDAQLPPDPATPAPVPQIEPDRSAPVDPDMVTDAQLKALHTAMTVADILERVDRLAYVSGVIARDVESSKDLTRAEATMVLDELRDLVESRDTPDETGYDDTEPDYPDPADDPS